MKELIKVTENEQGQQLVSGRELHEVLEIGTQFTKWIQRMINYGFVEGMDFTTISQKRLTAQGNTTEFTDYILTLEMAKHIAMVQRTEIGMQVRNYFLECEKQALQITRKDKLRLQLFSGDDLLIAQAHNELVRLEVEEATTPLIEKIETDKPKVDAFDQYMNSDGTYTTRNACKMLELSEKKVFAWLRVKGLVFKNKTQPTALAIEKGYFKVIMKHGYPTMTITPLGIEYIRTNYEED